MYSKQLLFFFKYINKNQNMRNKILFLILTIIQFIIINCGHVSSNQLNLIINSYQNNVLKNYEEALEFKNNGTVSRFNIFFNLKRFMMKLSKNKIERNIEKLKLANENPSNKINHIKLIEETNRKEKVFLKEYRELLNIIRDTNELYLQCMRTLKKIFLIVIYITIFLTILAVGVIIYITSPRCKKYNLLIDEKNENNDNNKNKDSKIYKVVKIVNNLIKSDKKIE